MEKIVSVSSENSGTDVNLNIKSPGKFCYLWKDRVVQSDNIWRKEPNTGNLAIGSVAEGGKGHILVERIQQDKSGVRLYLCHPTSSGDALSISFSLILLEKEVIWTTKRCK